MDFHKNFPYEELIHTDHRELDNTPTHNEECEIGGKIVIVDALANLPRLSQFLGILKFELFEGRAVFVNSAFRSKAVNTAVGSTNKSDHRRGCAADIRVDGMTPDQVTRKIIASGLGYQQVIREFDRWTHVAIPTYVEEKPMLSKLIIDKQGTRAFA